MNKCRGRASVGPYNYSVLACDLVTFALPEKGVVMFATASCLVFFTEKQTDFVFYSIVLTQTWALSRKVLTNPGSVVYLHINTTENS